MARQRKLNNITSTPPKEVNHLVGIVVSENEPIDRAIKRFKKKYERSGVLKEFKKRAYFTKPSVKKRMKKVKAIRRAQRSMAEQN
jgi:small subunit ribosomal protein S21